MPSTWASCASSPRSRTSPNGANLLDLAGPRRAEWVVYAKEPFGGPQQVLDYLGRYTHRVAISNNRLIGLTDGRVTFRWKEWIAIRAGHCDGWTPTNLFDASCCTCYRVGCNASVTMGCSAIACVRLG